MIYDTLTYIDYMVNTVKYWWHSLNTNKFIQSKEYYNNDTTIDRTKIAQWENMEIDELPENTHGVVSSFKKPIFQGMF